MTESFYKSSQFALMTVCQFFKYIENIKYKMEEKDLYRSIRSKKFIENQSILNR
jgi:hypothetical protein